MEIDTKVTVHDAMTSNVITVSPVASVAEAALLMTKFKIGSLIVKSSFKGFKSKRNNYR